MNNYRTNLNLKRIIASCLLALSPLPYFLQTVKAQADWPYVGGDAGGMRYSKLEQINRRSVKDLRVAWIFFNVCVYT